MKHSTYLEKSSKPRLIVYEENGQPIDLTIKCSTRPTIEAIDKICRQRKEGCIRFIDVFDITVHRRVVVGYAELYYDDEIVGMRKFPDINMEAGDSLQVTFNLVIDCSYHANEIRYTLSD